MNTPLGVNYLCIYNKKGLTPQMIARAAAKHFERFGYEARMCYACCIEGAGLPGERGEEILRTETMTDA